LTTEVDECNSSIVNKSSHLLVFLLAALPLSAANLVEIVSKSLPRLPGRAASGNSGGYQFNRVGKRVLFTSDSTELVEAKTGLGNTDVYTLDLEDGSIALVSTNLAGLPGSRRSLATGISPGLEVFLSESEDLVEGDENELTDAFLRDPATGRIRRVGRKGPGSGLLDGHVTAAVPSLDGSRVVFVTESVPDLEPPILGGGAYLLEVASGNVRVLSTSSHPLGETPRDPLISRDGSTVVLSDPTSAGSVGTLLELVVHRDGAASFRPDLGRWLSWSEPLPSKPIDVANPVLSLDGRHLAFLAYASQTNFGRASLFWMDLSQPSDIRLVEEDVPNSPIAMSEDGTTLAFETFHTNSVTGLPGRRVRFWNAVSGHGSFDSLLTVPVSVTTEPEGASAPVFSPDGSRIAYIEERGVVSATATNLHRSLAIHELATGTRTTLAGSLAVAPGADLGWSFMEFLADGSGLLVETSARLVETDLNGLQDLYLVPTDGGPARLLTVAHTGASAISGDQASQLGEDSISADGRYVVFSSDASNLVPSDNNRRRDVFLRDRKLGVTHLISRNTNGVSANGASFDGKISSDGRFAFFRSQASDIVEGPIGNVGYLFRFEMASGTVLRLGAPPGAVDLPIVHWYSPSGDGEIVAFEGFPRAFVIGASSRIGVMVWRPRDRSVEVVSQRFGNLGLPWLENRTRSSRDGRRIVLLDGGNRFFGYDRETGDRHDLLPTNAVFGTAGPVAISPDGDLVAAVNLSAGGAAGSELWVGRFGTGTLVRVDSIADAQHREPVFSPDGRSLVVAEVPSDPTAHGNLVLYSLGSDARPIRSEPLDRTTNNAPANGRSRWPAFSADGQRVVFRSAASNLTPDDDNGVPDLFARDLPDGPIVRVTQGAEERTGPPLLDSSGQTVVFTTIAAGLLPGDRNGSVDVFAASVDLPEKLSAGLIRLAGKLHVEFVSRPDRAYRLEKSNSLAETGWAAEGDSVVGDGFALRLEIPGEAAESAFVRIRSISR
jgi:Tol biopolymer transport system component